MSRFAAVLAGLGMLGGMAVIFVPFILGLNSDKYGIVALPEGKGTVTLPEGRVGLWYRERVHLGQTRSGNSMHTASLPIPAGLAVRVRPLGGGGLLAQSPAITDDQSNGTNDMHARLFSYVEVPRAGRYAVRVRPEAEGRRDAGIGFGTAPTLKSHFEQAGLGVGIIFGSLALALIVRIVGGIAGFAARRG